MASGKSRKPVGRPPLEEANTEVLRLRFKASAVAGARVLAAKDRRTLNDWIRLLVDDAVAARESQEKK